MIKAALFVGTLVVGMAVIASMNDRPSTDENDTQVARIGNIIRERYTDNQNWDSLPEPVAEAYGREWKSYTDNPNRDYASESYDWEKHLEDSRRYGNEITDPSENLPNWRRTSGGSGTLVELKNKMVEAYEVWSQRVKDSSDPSVVATAYQNYMNAKADLEAAERQSTPNPTWGDYHKSY